MLGRPAPRVSGRPPSGNGASSFHLSWVVPAQQPLVAVSAVVEIVEPPIVDDLHFWALQATFSRPHGGAAHLGLQHNRRFPDSGAVNWGGYAPKPPGGLLPGTASRLPSTPGDANTRDYRWRPHRPYRLTIERGELAGEFEGIGWAGIVEDVTSGARTLVRELLSSGTTLRAPVVWTECFADCAAPSSRVQWSELVATTERGDRIGIEAVKVSYQHRSRGGCDNTNVAADGVGWTQTTNAVRSVGRGVILPLRGA